ncbi:hypothetical protein D9613_007280 [Agrocybe pediades]|uniref:Uncharacterized protein n=1 Tax=Agrocybe pediades TaxID=84607 RepID=A0A8H4QHH4_9AGAR|nr:hypothetical protein D9613_007280 [Agrocybe pediades]KAF9558323.1 hypothetical protein CPC08DRAFT_560181 [Agrocybe pediades]
MAKATQPGNPFTSYSPFFSSGLLAHHTAYPGKRRGTFNSDVSEPWDSGVSDDEESNNYESSPSRPSSPVAYLDNSVLDVEMSEFIHTPEGRRSATPTPQTIQSSPESSTPLASAKSNMQSSTIVKNAAQQMPRLRRRRSSLTQGTSPMASIRSPARSAVNAMHLQKQIPLVSRSRSGSVGTDAMGMLSIATDGTSLVGRMRSGSCSSVTSLPNPPTQGSVAPVGASRPRRVPRRKPVQAPAAPPPNTPLPALPPTASSQTRLRPSANLNINLQQVNAAASAAVPSLKSPTVSKTSARARGLSVSKSGLDGAENRIAE